MHFILSSVLMFAGLAFAIGVLFLNGMILFRTRRAGPCLIYIGVAGFYAYSVIGALIRQSTGIACALSPWRTLLLYGGLLLLHIYFLFDSLGDFRKAYAPPPEPEQFGL